VPVRRVPIAERSYGPLGCVDSARSTTDLDRCVCVAAYRRDGDSKMRTPPRTVRAPALAWQASWRSWSHAWSRMDPHAPRWLHARGRRCAHTPEKCAKPRGRGALDDGETQTRTGDTTIFSRVTFVTREPRPSSRYLVTVENWPRRTEQHRRPGSDVPRVPRVEWGRAVTASQALMHADTSRDDGAGTEGVLRGNRCSGSP
jgi:hypothetical protein